MRKTEELPEWKKHYLENRNKSVDEKRDDQREFLVDLLTSMKSLFGPIMSTALKKIERETLSDEELTILMEHMDVNELLARIKGLKMVFPSKYYAAVEEVIGGNTFKNKTHK